jgi:hypothetical protein
MRARDVAPAAFLVAFAVAGLVGASRLSIGTAHQPGPGFFPLVLAAVLLLTSLGLLGHALRPRPGAPLPAAPGTARRRRGKAIATVGALFVYALIMETVGFTTATFLLLAFLFLVIEPRRWVIALGGSLVTAVVTWVVFKLWLGVQLPVGPWGF